MDPYEKTAGTERYHQQSFLEEEPRPAPAVRSRRTVRKQPASVQNAPDGRLKQAEKLLTRICLRIGVPMHMRGYSMLYSGVLMAIAEPELIYNLTNGLYVRLAQKYTCSASCVERDIRNVISVTWERGSPEEAARLIGASLRPSCGKPTNGELISLLVERLRVESDVV